MKKQSKKSFQTMINSDILSMERGYLELHYVNVRKQAEIYAAKRDFNKESMCKQKARLILLQLNKVKS